MEYINKIEIGGQIGYIALSPEYFNMSVCTQETFKDLKGNNIIQITWHSVRGIYTESITKDLLEKFQKGSFIYVCGSIKEQRYTDADGKVRSTYYIFPKSIKVL